MKLDSAYAPGEWLTVGDPLDEEGDLMFMVWDGERSASTFLREPEVRELRDELSRILGDESLPGDLRPSEREVLSAVLSARDGAQAAVEILRLYGARSDSA